MQPWVLRTLTLGEFGHVHGWTATQVQEAPARGASLDLRATLQIQRRSSCQLDIFPGVFHRHLSAAGVNLHHVFFCLLFSSYLLRVMIISVNS